MSTYSQYYLVKSVCVCVCGGGGGGLHEMVHCLIYSNCIGTSDIRCDKTACSNEMGKA